MGSTLKGKNLLLEEEQILSFKSGSLLTRESRVAWTESTPLDSLEYSDTGRFTAF